MRAIVGIVLVSALGVGCTAFGDPSGDPRQTELQIALIWATRSPIREWTLICPAGGTHPDPTRACAQLTQLGDAALTELNPDAGCDLVYGGPTFAEIRGMLDGRPVDTHVGLDSGCRYRKRYSFVIPFPSAR